METDTVAKQKAHRPSRVKKKQKKSSSEGSGAKNTVAKPGAFARRVRLAADRAEKRAVNPHIPIDRTSGDAPPSIVTVVGPSGVGKSTIIRNLVKHYAKRSIPSITGPVTLVSGRRKRLTFLEVGSDLASMLDAAKIADVVLLVIDAAFGFEMETFEFLNVAAAHGMPKVITVLTHLDKFHDGRQIRRAKKAFKDRIWAELYDGAKVFYLSGITTSGDYLSREILNLARFISVAKVPMTRWRSEHPYVLADRVEDVSPKSLPEHAHRTVAAYGYVRGAPLRTGTGEWRLHLAGVGDIVAHNVEPLPDPCPPPQLSSHLNDPNSTEDPTKSKRKISQRERILYAPMAPEVDGIAYDRDAVYIDLNPKNIRFSEKSSLVLEPDGNTENGCADEDSSDGEGEKMVKTLQKASAVTMDDRLRHAQLQLVEGGKALVSKNFSNERIRRKANFNNDDIGVDDDNDSSEGDNNETDDNSDVGVPPVEVVALHFSDTGDTKSISAPVDRIAEELSDSDSDNEMTDHLRKTSVDRSTHDQSDSDGAAGDLFDKSHDAEGRGRNIGGIKERSDSDSSYSSDSSHVEADKLNGSRSKNLEADHRTDLHSGSNNIEKLTVQDETLAGAGTSNPEGEIVYCSPKTKIDVISNDDSNMDTGDMGNEEAFESNESDDCTVGNEDGVEDDDDEVAQRWKNNMLENAERKFRAARPVSKVLLSFIYEKDSSGDYKNSIEIGDCAPEDDFDETHVNSDPADTFFRPKRKRVSSFGAGELMAIPDSFYEDITRRLPDSTRDWSSNLALCRRLRSTRWGTGQSGDGINGDDMGSNEENLDGDYEDIETGEVHKAGENMIEINGTAKVDQRDDDDVDAIRAEKLERKQRFNEEWDEHGGRRGRNADEEDDDDVETRNKVPDVRSRKALRGAAEREVDIRKVERERIEKIKREEMQHMDMDSRRALEGMSPGQYVRMELQDVPVEFVKYFDPCVPILLGGLRQGDDEGSDVLRARIRRHRFKRGVLKSNDPAIFSIGWRRFQSVPIYHMEDAGGRKRFIKYTPEFLHCNMTFYGPRVGPGAGMVVCQSLGRERGGFRIAATGVVTETGVEDSVVKKLKLVGEAVRVHKNTAFIKGMFNSELEAAKFIGAGIRTVSGIRGTVKKAISETALRGNKDRTVAKAPVGTFRAGFEDRILMSDLVFLRAWVPVALTKFYTVAATLLDDDRRENNGVNTWRMRTVREMRESQGLPIPTVKDSIYKDVERGKPIFAPVRVPRAVEGALPFASKSKLLMPLPPSARGKGMKERKADISKERAVVSTRKERKERQLLQAVYNVRKEKLDKRAANKQSKLDEKRRVWMKENASKEGNAKLRSKRKFAIEGAREARAKKRARGNGQGDADLDAGAN